MRRFSLSVLSAFLLLCLTRQPVFSMDDKEEETQGRPSAQNLGSLREGATASEKKQTCHFFVGPRSFAVGFPEGRKPAFHHSFEAYNKEKYCDFMAKLERFLNITNLKSRLTSEKFLELCQGYLKQVEFPYRIWIEDQSILLILGLKRRKEDNSFVLDEGACLLPKENGKIGRFTISMFDLIQIAEKVCSTRVQLLKIKEDVLSEEEAYLKECIEAYERLFLFVDEFKASIEDPTFFFATQSQTSSNLIGFYNKLREYYLLKKRYRDYVEFNEIQSNLIFNYLGLIDREIERLDQEPLASRELSLAKHKLLDVLFSLAIGEYAYYFSVGSEMVRNSFEKAQKYNRKLRDAGDMELYEKNQGHLESLRVRLPAVRLDVGWESARIFNVLREIETDKRKDPSLKEHRSFLSFMRKHLDKTSEISSETISEIRKAILQFQNTIMSQNYQTLLTSPSDLFNFYEIYRDKIRLNQVELVDAIWLFVNFFIKIGQLEGVIDHINAFMKACEREEDYAGSLRQLNIIRVVVRSLQGHPKELLEISEGFEREEDHRKKERMERKKQQEKRRMDLVREAVRAAQVSSSVTAAECSLLSSPSLRKSDPSSSLLARALPSVFSTEVPLETKAAKEARHQARLEKKAAESFRQVQQPDAAAASFQGAAAASAAPVEEDMGIQGYFPFDLDIQKNLTTLQRRLEREMETGSWNFSRDELRTYYENFGCKISQKGSHVKAALPKFEEIELPDGEPLVINFNMEEFDLQGGAFTFARWGHTVPQYLRPQICEARKRIQAFKRVINEEVRRIIQDEAYDRG